MNEIVKELVKDGGKTGTNKTVELLLDKFLVPKLEKILNAPKDIFVIRELFKIYLNKKYENDKYMNTIVFQTENKTIDELYIPLTIVQKGKRNKIVIDNNMKDIFDKPCKMLILDTAGTGKSTIVKFLSLLCIKKEWGFPFIIELRRIEKDQTIEEYIINEISLNNSNINGADIKDVLRRGDFIFFLDGYDEILEDNKTNVTREMREFIASADKNCFVLTSREDDCLSEFSDFIKYDIEELNKEEAYELIRKYDNYGEVSEALINEIEENDNYEALEEFLGNPLMVSLLYLTYRYKGVLQYKKHIFYRQVYDALYDRHDCIKGIGAKHDKKSKLDIEDFRKVLCAMGFISVKEGKVEFEKDEIIDVINKAINVFPEITANATDFFYDILHAVPLFVEEGPKYKWAHKSFSEYFAAVFICREYKEYAEQIMAELLLMDNNYRFYNMLDFCYDMDYKSTINNLIYPTLCEFESFYDTNSMMQNKENSEIKIFNDFICDVYFVKLSNKPKPKNRDVFYDIIEAHKVYKKVYGSRFSYINCVSKSDNTVMISKNKNTHIIVKLMNRKGVDVFKEARIKEYSNRFLKDIDVGMYKISGADISDNTILKKNQDAIASRIFHGHMELGGRILDIEKCKQKIKEIEADKNRVHGNFFSLV